MTTPAKFKVGDKVRHSNEEIHISSGPRIVCGVTFSDGMPLYSLIAEDGGLRASLVPEKDLILLQEIATEKCAFAIGDLVKSGTLKETFKIVGFVVSLPNFGGRTHHATQVRHLTAEESEEDRAAALKEIQVALRDAMENVRQLIEKQATLMAKE